MLSRAVTVASSVTLVHSAKAAGRNETSINRNTRLAPGNIVLDRGNTRLIGKGNLEIETLGQKLQVVVEPIL